MIDVSDRGSKICAGRLGSLGYETIDAKTYATWVVDYLKLDSCYADSSTPEKSHSIMRDALNASGRPILYSLCGNKYKSFEFSNLFAYIFF